GGGHAHAEDYAAEHGQDEAYHRDAAGEADNGADEGHAEAGDVDAAGDDAGHGAGDGDGDGAARAGREGVHELARGDAGFALEEAGHDGNDDAYRRGELDGLGVGADHDHEHHDGREQVDV